MSDNQKDNKLPSPRAQKKQERLQEMLKKNLVRRKERQNGDSDSQKE